MATSRSDIGYQPGLDGLRALAALSVVGFHARIAGFSNGAIGVDVFFTLSGFLITSLLLRDIARHGRPSLRRFYVNRALRLLPAYFTVVVVAVAFDFVIDAGGTLKGAVLSLGYVANWGIALAGMGLERLGSLGSLEHTWTLSIEEQFYLVWPALLGGLVVLARRRLPLAASVTALLAASYLLTAALLLGGAPIALAFDNTACRALELLAGALLAIRWPATGLRPGMRRWIGPLGLLAMGFLAAHVVFRAPTPRWEMLVGWPGMAVATCAVIAAIMTGGNPLSRLLTLRPLVQIGKVSYGLYLWHFPVLTTVDTALGLDTWPAKLLALAISGVFVVASYRFIELPFLRLKQRGMAADRLPRPRSLLAALPASETAAVND